MPRSLQPDTHTPGVTVGWLVDGAESGRIPLAHPWSAQDTAAIRFRLSLMQRVGRARKPCRPANPPVVIHLARGQSVGIHGGPVWVTQLDAATGTAPTLIFGTSGISASLGHRLTTVVGPVELELVGPRADDARLWHPKRMTTTVRR